MPIDPRDIPDSVHWYEGMLLLPEHFQAAAQRQEALSGYVAQIAMPYGWGVQQIATEIVEGVLHVRTLDAVMPDGLVIRYRSNDADAEPLNLDLKGHQQTLAQRKKIVVHVVVPAFSAATFGQDDADTGALRRYRSIRGLRFERDDGHVAADGPAMDQMRERPWLRPVLKLYVTASATTAPPDKYSSLPIMRIEQNAEAAIVAHRYEPPQTAIGGSNEIYKCARDVAAELRDKARFLNERLQRTSDLPERTTGAGTVTLEMQLRLLARQFKTLQHNVENLQALARTVPRIEALMKDRHSHPQLLYFALCDVVGDLALLGGELNLPEIPAYQHADALIAFDFLEQHIRLMLETLNQRHTVIAFERVTDGRFELALKHGDLGKRFVIGAVRHKGSPATPIVNWVVNAAITSADKVDDLKVHRTGGATRTKIDRDDSLDLDTPEMTTLFQIEVGDAIDEQDEVLVIENNASDGPMSILLYVPRETGEANAPPIRA